jgi:pimeloyl-ACP methyl ester carboxylesterase
MKRIGRRHWLAVVWLVACSGLASVAIAAKPAEPSPFAAAPKPVESFDVGTLHFDKFGSGEPTLVLIPGLSEGAWAWYGTIARFSPQHAIYVVTLPGFDGRPPVKEKSLYAAFRRDFWMTLDRRKIEKPIIVGHSLGGTLAIALAEEHSERLSGVVAVDGLPVFPMFATLTAKQREAMAGQMANMFGSMTKDSQLASEKEFMSSIGTNKPELVEPCARLESRSDPKATAAWLEETLTTDLRPKTKQCTVPLLEIMPYEPADNKGWFAQSQQQSLDFYKSLVSGAPKAQVVAIAPSRHFVMLDQPEQFYKAVDRFVGSIHR